MSRLKVLHLITTFPRLSGAADNTRHTANLLDPDRYEVHLAFGPAESDTSGVSGHVRTIIVHPLVRPIAPLSDLRALFELCLLFRRERYDIVHTHNAKAGVLGRIAARLTGVPVVVHTAHNISFVASSSRFANWLYRIADRLCAALTDKIVAVSVVNVDTYLDAHIGRPEQYVIIYSGVATAKYLDTSGRTDCRAELGVSGADVLVAWIGRLNRQKDPVTFVRAAKLLHARFPQTRFLIVGEDPLGESLEDEVRRAIGDLELEKSVRLLGYRPDVHRILAAADLVMHTSLYEGMGRGIVETMLAGRPLVATAVDGVREAVVSGERGGILVQPKDPEALALAASQLIDDPRWAAQLAAAGQDWARERFEVKDMVTAIDQLYRDLCATVLGGNHGLAP